MSEKIRTAVYFEKKDLDWMDRYVLEKKLEDRTYSRNRFIEEAIREKADREGIKKD